MGPAVTHRAFKDWNSVFPNATGIATLLDRLNLRKDGMHTEAPPADIMRLQVETLRPHIIIQALEGVFRL
jgi:hypothetical protein